MVDKVLYIAHKLQPHTGPEAIQSTRIVKHLSRLCETHVISTTEMPVNTGDAICHYVEDKKNTSMNAKLETLFSRIGVSLKFCYPDSKNMWVGEAIKKAGSVINKEKISTIITRSMPFSTHMVGQEIKTNDKALKWICSLSDPIAINPFRKYISSGLKNKLFDYEKTIFENADVITHTNSYIVSEYLKYYPSLEKKFYILTNMFDRKLENEKRFIKLDSEPMILSYAGRLYSKREPSPLFRAVQKFVAKVGREKICLQIIGAGKSKKLQYLIRRHGLNDIIVIYPFLEEEDLVRMLKQSHLLVTIDGNCSGNNFFSPSKNFDYLSIIVPILGLTSKGPTSDLIEDTKSGTWRELRESDAIYESLIEYYQSIKKGYDFAPDINKIMNYHAEAVVNRFYDDVVIPQ